MASASLIQPKRVIDARIDKEVKTRRTARKFVRDLLRLVARYLSLINFFTSHEEGIYEETNS